MITYRRFLNIAVPTALLLLVASTARSQPIGKMPAGTTLKSATATGIYQFTTDLESGGDYGMTQLGAQFNILRSLGDGKALGMSLDYNADLYSFGGDTGFGGADPWGTINNLSLGISYQQNLGKDWQFRIIPSVTASGESSASFGDSLTWGAVFAFTRTFSEKLTIGIGGGVFTGLEETRGYPFLAIRWQFAPGWTLQNPFRPGPAGPAGLEVSYKTEKWEFGAGGAYRSYRFRLADEGFVPGGIGEHNGTPLFIRATRALNKSLTLDLYAGVLVGGSLEEQNANGLTLAKSDFDPAPLLALSLTGRF